MSDEPAVPGFTYTVSRTLPDGTEETVTVELLGLGFGAEVLDDCKRRAIDGHFEAFPATVKDAPRRKRKSA